MAPRSAWCPSTRSLLVPTRHSPGACHPAPPVAAGPKQASKRAAEQIRALTKAVDVLCEASKPNSEAYKEERE